MQDCGSCGDPGRPGTPSEEFLFPPLLLGGVPIIVEIAAAKAAVKFGSEAMAAVTVSTIEAGRCPNCIAGNADNLGGENIGCPRSCG